MEEYFENDAIIQLEKEYNKKKSEATGLEYEEKTSKGESAEEESAKKPFDADKIRIDQQMLSVKYMIELMDDNLIELNPGYQRNRVWKENKRKSLLIESLMLRIPIPAFYFYENEDGTYQVIDGQQRLSTIKEFVKGEFKLSGLEYLSEKYNKKTFEELDIKYKQRIYRTQIAVNILDARSPKKVIYEIFRRVNTGGVNLNRQEMRNAICKQEVRDFLKAGTRNPNYLLATREKIKDDRMDSQELVLRFYAFYLFYNYETETLDYKFPNISDMLDEAIEILNTMTCEKRAQLGRYFDEAMLRSYHAFGQYCFSKIQPEGDFVKRNLDYINKSLYSSFAVLLLNPKYDSIHLESYQKELLVTLAKTLENHSYFNSITAATGDQRNINLNFLYSRKVLEECLD